MYIYKVYRHNQSGKFIYISELMPCRSKEQRRNEGPRQRRTISHDLNGASYKTQKPKNSLQASPIYALNNWEHFPKYQPDTVAKLYISWGTMLTMNLIQVGDTPVRIVTVAKKERILGLYG